MRYNCHAKQDIRQEWIRAEMEGDRDAHPIKLKKRFISWLFRHYSVFEDCVKFYDWEGCDEYDGRTKETLTEEEFWEERLTFNNWIDVMGEGIWYASQKSVDEMAMRMMNDFRKAGRLKGRCWAGWKEWNGHTFFHICLYGRDIHEYDHLFMMLPKKENEQLHRELATEHKKWLEKLREEESEDKDVTGSEELSQTEREN